jgi:hypothetical protein
MSDPGEQFLTAAEEGDLDKLKELYEQRPNLLMVHTYTFLTKKFIIKYLWNSGPR